MASHTQAGPRSDAGLTDDARGLEQQVDGVGREKRHGRQEEPETHTSLTTLVRLILSTRVMN